MSGAATLTIARTHNGQLGAYVDGRPIDGAFVTGIVPNQKGELVAAINIPIVCTNFAELVNGKIADNVIEFPRRS